MFNPIILEHVENHCKQMAELMVKNGMFGSWMIKSKRNAGQTTATKIRISRVDLQGMQNNPPGFHNVWYIYLQNWVVDGVSM